jgi:hypothetical protein
MPGIEKIEDVLKWSSKEVSTDVIEIRRQGY